MTTPGIREISAEKDNLRWWRDDIAGGEGFVYLSNLEVVPPGWQLEQDTVHHKKFIVGHLRRSGPTWTATSYAKNALRQPAYSGTHNNVTKTYRGADAERQALAWLLRVARKNVVKLRNGEF